MYKYEYLKVDNEALLGAKFIKHRDIITVDKKGKKDEHIANLVVKLF